MRKIVSFLAILALTVLFSRKASADEAADKCITACLSHYMACVPGLTNNLATLCSVVPECKDIPTGGLKTYSDVCDACAKGATNACPGSGTDAPAGTSPPPAKKQPRTAQPADPCKSARGEWVDEPDGNGGTRHVCINLAGLHGRIVATEAHIKNLYSSLGAIPPGQPVPTAIGPQIQGTGDDIKRLGASVGVMSEEMRIYYVKTQEAFETLNQRFNDMNDKLDKVACRTRALERGVMDPSCPAEGSAGFAPRSAPAPQIITVPAARSNIGFEFSLGGYVSQPLLQTWDHYLTGEGGEVGLGLTYKDAIFFGTAGWGYGSRYGGKDLQEQHGRLGIGYRDGAMDWRIGGMLSRRLTLEHEDTVHVFGGAFIEPRYNVGQSSGHQFYLYGLLGMGYSHAQHPDVDLFENNIDGMLRFGLGWAFDTSKTGP